MKKMLIVLMLLAFSTAISGCDLAGSCPHGICSEEHSKASGPPSGEKSEE